MIYHTLVCFLLKFNNIWLKHLNFIASKHFSLVYLLIICFFGPDLLFLFIFPHKMVFKLCNKIIAGLASNASYSSLWVTTLIIVSKENSPVFRILKLPWLNACRWNSLGDFLWKTMFSSFILCCSECYGWFHSHD